MRRTLALLALLLSWSYASAQPYSLFPTTPTGYQALNYVALTGAVQIQFLTAGTIPGLRYYRVAADDNTTSRNLIVWSTGGTNEAECATASESGTGWQTCYFTNAFPVSAGSVYIISGDWPNLQGVYYSGGSGCNQGTNNPTYLSCQKGWTIDGLSTFPTNTNSNTLFVDVLFNPCQ